jgi:hypothetical protein
MPDPKSVSPRGPIRTGSAFPQLWAVKLASRGEFGESQAGAQPGARADRPARARRPELRARLRRPMFSQRTEQLGLVHASPRDECVSPDATTEL